MSNFTFQIKQAKIFEFRSKGVKAWGKLAWTDGTADFEQKFETTHPQIIALIEANRAAETNFKVCGTMTINPGFGEYKGKNFQTLMITQLEVGSE